MQKKLKANPQLPLAYKHPAIQEAICITWFQYDLDVGVVFREHFSPISVPAIAFILTVVRAVKVQWPWVFMLLVRSSVASMSGPMAHARRLHGMQSGSRLCTGHTSVRSMTSSDTALSKVMVCSNAYEAISSWVHGKDSSCYRL
jgi:hypothetical protein